MNRSEHWESVYRTKPGDQISWTQREPRTSLALIRECCPPARPDGAGARVIDVGGGTSVLVDRLLDADYSVAALDIAPAALEKTRQRLGERAERVRWIVGDVTRQPALPAPLGMFDVWHDRAVFHFLTDAAERAAYVALLASSVPQGGHAIIATFALDGPERCSGLPVCRYDAPSLAKELGEGFALLKSVPEIHVTPSGKPQSFQYSVLRRSG